MKLKYICALPLLGCLLQGCAAAGITVAEAGAGVGMSAGIDHTLNGIVFKTFTATLDNVRFAAMKSLYRMGMPVTADASTDSGWKLTATATDRTIDVELERLTGQATRMRVVANHGNIFFKDTSTATEIILQTAQTLQDQPNATAESSRKKKG